MRRVPYHLRTTYRVSCINWAGEVYKRTTTNQDAADRLWAEVNGRDHVLFAAYLVDGAVQRTYQRQALYVIMGNDFPAGIASGEAKGKETIHQLMERDRRQGVRDGAVHWRLYGYTVDGRELETVRVPREGQPQ